MIPPCSLSLAFLLYLDFLPSHIWISMRVKKYHVLTSSHQALVDDLGRIVVAGVDVHTFLDDRVGASS